MKNSCEGLWDRHLVKDYGRDITSIEEANEIFKEAILQRYNLPENNTEEILNERLNDTREENGMYINFNLGHCLELEKGGKLYTRWCGD